MIDPKLKNLAVRTLSGVVLLVVVLGCTLLSEFSFLAMTLVLAAGGMLEFYRLSAIQGAEVSRVWALITGIAVVTLAFLIARDSVSTHYAALIVPLVAAQFVAELSRRRTMPIINISVALGGVIYVALPMALLVMLSYDMQNQFRPAMALTVIFTVWVNDIFAYLTGITFGRHRLCERISPKKSWEGFVGGVVFATAFAVCAGHYYFHQAVLPWAITGLLVALGAVAGDLVESMFKREVNIKDTGNLIPGHGGILDRFDALLIAVPAFVTANIILRIFAL